MLRKSLPSILFLALCVPPLAAAEDSLVGTWEASGEVDGVSITTRLVFLDDGNFEVSSVSRTEDGYWRLPEVVFEEDDDLTAAEADALNQLFREAWPETPLEASTLLGSGTYTTSGDSLRLEWISADLRLDDRDFTDFMVSHWIQFGLTWEAAIRAFEGRDFPEEDRRALEEELTVLYQDILTGVSILDALNESPPRAFELRDGGEVLVLHYPEIPVDALLFQQAEPRVRPQAKPLTYRRVDVASAVSPATWGGVKATLAP